MILFAIFNIIVLNSISNKNLKASDIFKGNISEKYFNPKNKTEFLNSINDLNLKDKKGLVKLYNLKNINITKKENKKEEGKLKKETSRFT